MVVVTVPAISVDSTRAGRRTVVLAAATTAFFVVTLDAAVVNVALPRIGTELQAGIPALQWVVDGYTLMFVSLLMTAGVLSDRLGASRALIAGMALFVLAPVACGLAPAALALIAARFVQGAAAEGHDAGLDGVDRRLLILTGLVAMTAGLALLAVVPARTAEWVLAALMVLVGLAGPFVMPPTIAVLMDSVPASRGGVVSGVFNTSRQVGGALAVAVFGALLARPAGLEAGLRISVGIAAVVSLLAATTALLLNPGQPLTARKECHDHHLDPRGMRPHRRCTPRSTGATAASTSAYRRTCRRCSRWPPSQRPCA